MIRKSILCPAAVGLIAASSLAQAPIERLAPRNTVFVAGVNNVLESREHLKATSLWSLANSEPFAEMWDSMMADVGPALDEACAELGVERDALTYPDGAVGVALFWVRDEEIGMPYPGLLVYADWGDGADGTSAIIDKVIAKVQEQEGLTPETMEIVGRHALRIDLPRNQPQEGEDEFDDIDMGGPGMGGMFGDPAAALENIESVYYVRAESAFLMCTDLPALTDALEVLDGKEHPSLADRDDFQGVMKQTGGGDAYAAWLTRDATQLMGGQQGLGMAAMFVPMLKQFVGDIHGFGSATRMDGKSAMIEKTVAVYMPSGRSGLTALMDTQASPTGLPAFAGPDVVSYNTVNFEFKGLPVLVQAISQMFPMLPMQGMPGDEGPSPIDVMRMVCEPLGPQVHIIQYAGEDLAPAEAQPLFAIQSSASEQFEAFVTQSGMVPVDEGRELGDGRIFKLALDEMGGLGDLPGMSAAQDIEGPELDMSLGMHPQFLFIGPTGAVEGALAASPDAKAAPTDRIGWGQAQALLGDKPVIGWGYIDLPTMIETQVEAQKEMMAQMMEQFSGEDAGSEEMAEDEQAMMENPVLVMLQEFDWSSLHHYLGPAVWEAHATEQGFVINSYLLEPAEAK